MYRSRISPSSFPVVGFCLEQPCSSFDLQYFLFSLNRFHKNNNQTLQSLHVNRSALCCIKTVSVSSSLLRGGIKYHVEAEISKLETAVHRKICICVAMETKKKKGLVIEDYPIEGLSIAGHETCVILPSLNLAFDIGKCPQRAISQQFLFISHGHMDHIGGLPMYVATRGLYRMSPPTIIVPKVIKENVEKIFEAHRAMDQSELKHTLIGLDLEEEFFLRKDLKVKAFKTYHVIPSQGYVVYSVKQKLKPEYVGLPGDEIKKLKFSGVEITYTTTSPEVAFTGDTTSDFIVDDNNADVLKAKVLIMESTYVENTMSVENARDYGHTHLSEIVNYASRFENKAIVLIHFSARYQLDVIQVAVSALRPPLAGRVFALTEGF
ncbi:hypothetical protein QVD17_10662 [Tagetes erecta]|uniref:Metallo-beta-lactamase domain-containing protein n=1 Tax=Tagetes erecta TaxID=13708 RepID=A0AAD8L6Y4_TARER|nr:hypothetical protein QVD17_10662 [Tagetes erecta]